MKLHDLHPTPGSRKPARRVGRGHGSGRGKTAGRGTKGQKSRAGGNLPAWFGCGLALAIAAGEADGCGFAGARALICRVCSGVFSPLKDGSCRNFNSHAGSTRAPSLVRRGGKRSLPSGVW